MKKNRFTIFLLLIIIFTFFINTHSAEAAIAFVKNIGIATKTGNITFLALTLGAGVSVASGHSIIIGFSGTNLSTPVVCSDSASNSYVMNVTKVNGSGGSVSIISAHNVNPLVAGNIITCTFPGGGSGRAMSANEFSGLAGSSTLDKTATLTGNSTLPISGSTAITTQANELLFGAFWFGINNSPTVSSYGSGYTQTNTVILTSKLATEYQVVGVTGAYSAGITITRSNQWAGAIVTFKAAASVLPTSGNLFSSVYDTTSNSVSVGYNSIMWKGALGGVGLNEGKVRFQFATASAPTGPWNFYGGATCGALDWFDSLGSDNPVELKGSSCVSAWNNKRYFRYKVQICSNDCVSAGVNTPTINDIVINWSP